MRAHLCGVPHAECEGSTVTVNKMPHKAHSTPTEAFRCHRNYLLRQGYTMIGNRELRPPDGGPVRVLTKPSRFGASLRGGKRGTDNQVGQRVTYQSRDRHNGTIISA